MNRIKSLLPVIGLGAAILTIAATPALSQGKGMGHGKSMMQERMGERFASMDENGDGLMSIAEHDAHTGGMFAAMDADSSKTLTKAEFMSVSMGGGPQGNGPMAGKRQEKMKAKKSAKFTAMDTNEDGEVSSEEFATFTSAEFSSTDANSDGNVDLTEFVAKHGKH